MKKLIVLLMLVVSAANAQYSTPGGQGSYNLTSLMTNIVTSGFSEVSMAAKYPLILWLDANNVTTPVEGTQEEWIDSSGRNNHATNSTAAQRPIWHAYALNNHPGFTFNGSSQFLLTPGFLNGTYNNNITVFLVTSRKVGAANAGPLSLGDYALTSSGTAPGTNTVGFNSRLNYYLLGGNGIDSGGNFFQNAGMFDLSAPVIQSWIYSSTNCIYGVNGCEIFNDNGQGVGNSSTYPYNRSMGASGVRVSFGNSSIAQPVGVGLGFLNTGANQAFWDGDINEILVYQGSFTHEEHALMVKYLQKKWSLNSRTVFFAGDSICFGNTITDGGNYPSRTMGLLNGVPYTAVTNQGYFSAVNVGWSGATVSSNNVSTGAGAGLVNVFPFSFQQMIMPGDIAVLEGLTNDGDRAAATNVCYTNYVLWHQKVHQALAKTIAMTVLPRTNVTGGASATNAFEQWRRDMNAMIRANWTKWADGLADVALDPTIGVFPAASSLTYYPDGVHPSSLANLYIATNLSAVIQSVAGLTPTTGINPVITVAASPFSYTNITGAKHVVFVSGGTVSAVAINGTTVVAGSNTSVPLQNGDYVTVTYSVAPTMSRKFY